MTDVNETHSNEQHIIGLLVAECLKKGFKLSVLSFKNSSYGDVLDCSGKRAYEIVNEIVGGNACVIYLNHDKLEGWNKDNNERAAFFLEYDGDPNDSDMFEYIVVPSKNPEHTTILQNIVNKVLYQGFNENIKSKNKLVRSFTIKEMKSIGSYIEGIVRTGKNVAFIGDKYVGNMSFYNKGTHEQFLEVIETSQDNGRLYFFNDKNDDSMDNAIAYVDINRSKYTTPLISEPKAAFDKAVNEDILDDLKIKEKKPSKKRA